MKGIKKILVIRLSSLGDLILSFPLLKFLKHKFPQIEIHYLTKEVYKDILKLNPNADKIISLNKSIKKTRSLIRHENYDLIIDIHKNFRSILLSTLNNKRISRYKKENLKKFLLVNFKINLFNKVTPVYKKYLNVLKPYVRDINYDFTTTELLFSKERIIQNNYIVISPASRHFTKTFPAEKFIEFINESVNEMFVLVGDQSENDKLICDHIESKCKNVLNYCGRFNMEELANVLLHSKYVICNDSAILHLSEALNKNVMSIFGSTVKEFGFYPQLIKSSVIENEGLYCRPCTHIGRNECPEKHFRCMLELKLTM